MTASDDPHDLERFVEAQGSVIDDAKRELRSGRKRGHWMWFVFPQLEGLGRSERSQYYGIASRAEAAAYLDHPVLGPRLRECTAIVNALEGRSVDDVFGSPDDRKFHSSMTLFDAAADDHEPFRTALEGYYDGERDQKTLELLDDG